MNVKKEQLQIERLGKTNHDSFSFGNRKMLFY